MLRGEKGKNSLEPGENFLRKARARLIGALGWGSDLPTRAHVLKGGAQERFLGRGEEGGLLRKMEGGEGLQIRGIPEKIRVKHKKVHTYFKKRL